MSRANVLLGFNRSCIPRCAHAEPLKIMHFLLFSSMPDSSASLDIVHLQRDFTLHESRGSIRISPIKDMCWQDYRLTCTDQVPIVAEDFDLIVADVGYRIIAVGVAKQYDCSDAVCDTGG
jgi:hypothetical protein